MVHTRGTLVFTVDGYELEIDHDGFTGGGGIFVRLAGQKHVLPVSVTVAKKLGAAIAAVGELA